MPPGVYGFAVTCLVAFLASASTYCDVGASIMRAVQGFPCCMQACPVWVSHCCTALSQIFTSLPAQVCNLASRGMRLTPCTYWASLSARCNGH